MAQSARRDAALGQRSGAHRLQELSRSSEILGTSGTMGMRKDAFRFSGLRLTQKLTLPFVLVLLGVIVLLIIVATSTTKAGMMSFLEKRAEILAKALSA